ncbi:ribosome hibernation-promoting factor, HPF/YfiA family [Parvularcula dongshanensis]|uniref:Ribosome hibernation promoting factor n=1 Tax=Parvularcula dongshanensis TaxID=1173995 RepID=A0A840I439_9PROT|nr:ribosome-associated translation inhibitor RaiA [Parvularcula dongshanensis]MBB4659537.1 ribosomal subunit interface protein [Parvularcula dongshanensis]
MDIQISGRAMDLGEALQQHVREAVEAGVTKYIGRPAEATVTFGKTNAKLADMRGREFTCEIVLHLASGVFLNTEGHAADAHSAFDEAMEKLDKRVRRYKRRLTDHHNSQKDPLPAEAGSSYVLQAPQLDEEETDDPPLVIAEAPATLRRMTVSDAVVQLDIGKDPVVMFRNAVSGDLSVVYRREDGNIGWIEGQNRA